MSILCKICNSEFKKIIPWQHLKTHGISSNEYSKQHGSLYSEETLEKHRLKIPHNKGKKILDPEKLKILHEGIKKREQRFQQGEFKRGAKKTQEQKNLLSKTSSLYALTHKDELKQRAIKAVVTKKLKNFDFGLPMRGKKHSQETKLKIKKILEKNNEIKSNQCHTRIQELLKLYNLSLINNLTEKVLDLKCNICSTYFSFTRQYFAPGKTFSEMCPTCFPRNYTQSQEEKDLFDFVKNLCPDAISNYRQHYHDKELDIYIPSKKIGIEYNGLYWHSENVLLYNNKSAKSDYEKYQYFKKQNIQVIGIFSDEWNTQQEIVKSRLKNILGHTAGKIFARCCEIKNVSTKDASAFCQQNHIMGRGRSNVRLGLYYNDTLVSIMTFVNNNLSRKSNIWEINRFASVKDTIIVGGASKLFKKFLEIINPSSVLSYADNRWSNGNLYKSLGFEKKSNGVPNYWYFLPNLESRIHRFNLRKNVNDDQNLTESENRQRQGYLKIWDFGSSKWVWNNSQ